MKASDVGTQEWKAEEIWTRYWLVGVQYLGRLVAAVKPEKDIVACAGLVNDGQQTDQVE